MRLQTYTANLRSATKLNYGLSLMVLFLGLSVCALSVRMLFWHERTVLVPPYLDERMTMSWTAANEAYYKSWGLYAANLFGNVTPRNAEFVADALGMFLDVPIYTEVRQQILALARDPKFAKALSFNYFTGQEVKFEASTHKVFVVGTLTVASYSLFTQQREVTTINTPLGPAEQRPVVYEMTFEMRAGRPLIVGFNSYPGNQPRTQHWLELNGARLKDERAKQEAAGIKVYEGAVIPLELDTSAGNKESANQKPNGGAATPVDASKQEPAATTNTPGATEAPKPSSVPDVKASAPVQVPTKATP